jgi:two-component system, response regulator PdtaR
MPDVANQIAPDQPVDLTRESENDTPRSRAPASGTATDPELLVPDRWLELRMPPEPAAAPAARADRLPRSSGQAPPATAPKKVLLLVADEVRATCLRAGLDGAGLQLIGQASAADRGVTLARTLRPDLIVVDPAALGAADGPILRQLRDERVVPLLMVGVGASPAALALALASGAAALLPAGGQPAELDAIVKLTLANWQELGQVERELAKTRQRLQDRIAVEQAKGLLMQSQPGLTEAAAYARLRSLSMSKRTTLGELARAVLLAHEAQRAIEDVSN